MCPTLKVRKKTEHKKTADEPQAPFPGRGLGDGTNIGAPYFGHKKTNDFSLAFLCPEQESNLHALNQALPPQSSVSTNFTIWANQYPVWGLQM